MSELRPNVEPPIQTHVLMEVATESAVMGVAVYGIISTIRAAKEAWKGGHTGRAIVWGAGTLIASGLAGTLAIDTLDNYADNRNNNRLAAQQSSELS